MPGEERHHHIQSFVLGETDDGVRLADALGSEEIHVGAVTSEDEAFLELLRHDFTARPVLVDDFDRDPLRLQHGGERLPDAACADDDGFLRLSLHAKVCAGFHFRKRCRCPEEIHIIHREQAVVAMRDQDVVVPLHHGDQERRREGEGLQRDMDQRRGAGEFRLEQAHPAAGEVLDVQCMRCPEKLENFTRCDEFRREDEVDVEIFMQVGCRLR